MAKSFYEDFQSRKSAQDSSGDMFETSAERIQQMQQMKSYLQQVQSMGASANDLKLSIKNRMKGAEAYVNAVAQGLLADPVQIHLLDLLRCAGRFLQK